jgi:hypothetical protein
LFHQDNKFVIFQIGATIDFYPNYGTNGVTGSVLTAGKWAHVACTWDTSDNLASIYIDGKLVKTFTDTTADKTGAAVIYIGRKDDGTQEYDGHLDEIRLWEDIRTESEIRTDMFQGGTLDDSGALFARWSLDAGATTTSASTVNTPANDLTVVAGGWAGAGAFTYGTSNLTMTGTSKNMNLPNAFDVYNLIINGTITANWVNAADSYLKIRGTVFTVGSSKTLSTTGYVRLYDEDLTLTFNTPATNISGVTSGLQTRHSSGTLSVPEVTTTYLLCETSGGTTQATGDLTITTELQVASGTTFNANGNTINNAEVDVNGGTLNITSSIFNFTTAGIEWNMTGASTLIASAATVSGYSAANPTQMKLPDTGSAVSTSDFQIIGNVKNFKAMGDTDITVVGTVDDCIIDGSEANIYQWHHTLDTAQLLDADAESDDDIKLPKPSLDNATELQTGG